VHAELLNCFHRLTSHPISHPLCLEPILHVLLVSPAARRIYLMLILRELRAALGHHAGRK
jgi:hypothetical protein